MSGPKNESSSEITPYPVQMDPFPTLARSSMGGTTAPILPLHKFNDETLMYVAVRIKEAPKANSIKTTSSILSKITSMFKSLRTSLRRNKPISSKDIRVIRMPRSDYMKYFARNDDNQYIGIEPEKQWTEQELEDKFGRYRDVKPPKWVFTEGNVVSVGDEREDERVLLKNVRN